MQVFATTPLALFMLLYIMVRGPVKGLWCLFLVLPMGAAAAMNVSGLGSIYMADFVIMAMWASLLLFPTGFSELFATLKPGRPGFILLLLLIVSLLSAFFMPRFFRGDTEVFMLVKVPDWGMAFRLRPLEPTTQNISQPIRFMISMSAFVILTTLFRKHGSAMQIHKGMILATWVNVLLAFLDVASHAVGFNDLLDVVRTSNMAMLDDQRIMGIKRIAGGFAEASAFGFYTMGLFAYWMRYWFSDKTSWKSGLIALLMFALIIRSTSSSTYLALIAFLGLYFLWHFRTMFKARRALLIYISTIVAVPMMMIVFIMLFTLNPILSGMLDEILLTKMSSDSGVERMMWNTQALTAMIDTYGLGAGIGSVRASSFLYACLGNIGIVGTALYLVFIAQFLLARPPKSERDTHTAAVIAGLQASCIGFLIQAMMSAPYPNLDVVFFAHAGLAMGLLRRQEILVRRKKRPTRARPVRMGAARSMA
ncbi:hypothetical protein [Donghicola eburneus]|jgi:hypothetical protein|uniref:hypothetical protein n=1 Tax=Donghicola eburneus TaxID=393278 RepID=UPI0008E89CDB|nr:hypothetical protein [Donghicola eburneus]SFQ57090.1 hypothetical protein SAMN05421764_106125 [Donghicola eburneus]